MPELVSRLLPAAPTDETRKQAALREGLGRRRRRVCGGGLFLRLAVRSILRLMIVQPTF
jgi:hypothetical protein